MRSGLKKYRKIAERNVNVPADLNLIFCNKKWEFEIEQWVPKTLNMTYTSHLHKIYFTDTDFHQPTFSETSFLWYLALSVMLDLNEVVCIHLGTELWYNFSTP